MAIPSFASKHCFLQNFPASAPSRDSNLGSHPPRPKEYKKRAITGSFFIFWGERIRTSEMPGPKPGALPLGDAPLRYDYYNKISRLNVKIFFYNKPLLFKITQLNSYKPY